jgi:glycosyltransferase involved in cell wall biosynthesis/predicted SAM-dependent methyltransferase
LSKSVELGGGETPRFHPNVDVRKVPGVDIVLDLESPPYPLEAGAFNHVYCSYALEHISWRKVKDVLKEMLRILAPGGKAELIIPNLQEQCKKVAQSLEWEENFSCMLFGDQNYGENSHRWGASPNYAVRLLSEIGFKRVEVYQHPNCVTDMIVIAYKGEEKSMSDSMYDRKYFEDGKTGYLMYRDFPVHYVTLNKVLERKPESVIEIGGARGYLCKLLNTKKVPTLCMDISEHCFYTRAVANFRRQDATTTPWMIFDGSAPLNDKAFDMCFSIAFMEHIPEDKLKPLILEMARVSKRGFHGITFTITKEDIDVTHRQGTIKPKEWWIAKFKEIAPDYPVEIVDKEDLERADVIDVPDGVPGQIKLNLGSSTEMFHYSWVNIDSINMDAFAKAFGYVFQWHNVVNGIPYADNSVYAIFASHLLEHLNYDDGRKLLKDCARALVPGGMIRIGIPDFNKLVKLFEAGNFRRVARNLNADTDNMGSDLQALYHLLTSGHQSFYTAASVVELLREIGGFKSIHIKPFTESDCKEIENETIDKLPEISSYVEAVKAASPTPQSYKVEVTHQGDLEMVKPPEAIGMVKEQIITVPSKTVDTSPPPIPVAPVLTPKTVPSGPLKLAILSTPFLETPPIAYGGLERIVADLAEELAKRGHEVTVFGADKSNVPGCKTVTFGPAINRVDVDWLGAEKKAYDLIAPQLDGFDVVHGCNWFGMEYVYKNTHPNSKVCHTHHGHLYAEWWLKSKPPFKLNFIAISKWMRDLFVQMGMPSEYAYNGVTLSRYPYSDQKRNGRLLFVGRLDTFKQPHVAIDTAKLLGMPIDIVGGSFVADKNYLEHIKNRAAQGDATLYLDATHEQKVKLIQEASCLLFPSAMGEPFGLVAVEAMSCGTPVAALNDGAIDEVVTTGGSVGNCFSKKFVSGKIPPVEYTTVQDITQTLKAAVLQAIKVPSATCRKNAELFSTEAMTTGYEVLYRKLLAGQEW